MLGTAVNLSGKFVQYSTAAIADGDLATGSAIDIGVLGGGSELPRPEVVYEQNAQGSTPVGGTLAMVLRVQGTGIAAVSALNAGAAASPQTEFYFYVVNKSKTRLDRYLGVCGEIFEDNADPENPARGSTLVPIFCDQDAVGDFHVPYEGACTLT